MVHRVYAVTVAGIVATVEGLDILVAQQLVSISKVGLHQLGEGGVRIFSGSKKMSERRISLFPFVPFVYKTAITECFHLLITVVESCLGVCVACRITQIVLHVGI